MDDCVSLFVLCCRPSLARKGRATFWASRSSPHQQQEKHFPKHRHRLKRRRAAALSGERLIHLGGAEEQRQHGSISAAAASQTRGKQTGKRVWRDGWGLRQDERRASWGAPGWWAEPLWLQLHLHLLSQVGRFANPLHLFHMFRWEGAKTMLFFWGFFCFLFFFKFRLDSPNPNAEPLLVRKSCFVQLHPGSIRNWRQLAILQHVHLGKDQLS